MNFRKTNPYLLPGSTGSIIHQSSKLYFYKRLVQAKLFIDQHYAENIDLFSIADSAFYSKFYFIREFKKAYRQTPHQYLNSVRIEKAKKLLIAGLPITKVCQAIGFEELSSFSRLFKKMTGINPSSFLLQHQALKIQVTKAPLTLIPHCFAYQYGWIGKEQFQTNES